MTRYQVATKNSVYELTNTDGQWRFRALRADGHGALFLGPLLKIRPVREPEEGDHLAVRADTTEDAWPSTNRELHTSRIDIVDKEERA